MRIPSPHLFYLLFVKVTLWNTSCLIWKQQSDDPQTPAAFLALQPKHKTPSHQVLRIKLMGVLHQHINSHYCSTEVPGVYNDKFLSVEAHQYIKWRHQSPTHTSAALE